MKCLRVLFCVPVVLISLFGLYDLTAPPGVLPPPFTNHSCTRTSTTRDIYNFGVFNSLFGTIEYGDNFEILSTRAISTWGDGCHINRNPIFDEVGIKSIEFIAKKDGGAVDDWAAIVVKPTLSPFDGSPNELLGIVAIRPTVTDRNWIRDAAGLLVSDDWGATNTDIRIHMGFKAGVDALYDSIIESLRAQHIREVILTGHSLGGALAALSLYRMHISPVDSIKPLGAYTLEAPKMGNEAFAKFMSQPHINLVRYTNKRDLFIVLPCPATEHLENVKCPFKACDEDTRWGSLWYMAARALRLFDLDCDSYWHAGCDEFHDGDEIWCHGRPEHCAALPCHSRCIDAVQNISTAKISDHCDLPLFASRPICQKWCS